MLANGQAIRIREPSDDPFFLSLSLSKRLEAKIPTQLPLNQAENSPRPCQLLESSAVHVNSEPTATDERMTSHDAWLQAPCSRRCSELSA